MRIILITLFAFGCHATYQSCSRLLANLAYITYFEGLDKLFIESAPYLQYSGKGDSDFGLYEQCLRSNSSYSSLQLTFNQVSMNLGICHNEDCSAEDLNQPQTKSLVKQFLNQSGIAEQFNISLESTDYLAINPQIPIYQVTPGFAFTLMILLIITSLSLALPIAQIIFNFKTRKERYSLLYIPGNIKIQNQSIENSESLLHKPKDSFGVKILKDFSIIENYKQLMNLSVPDQNLIIFNGIRSIAFLMVLMGHQFLILAAYGYKLELTRMFTSWLYLNLLNMLYSVDIFFWVGGFFIGFVLYDVKKVSQLKHRPSAILMIVVHRLLRIWPCYIIGIMLVTYIAPHIGGGPRWYLTQQIFECRTWWRNIFFIDNWFGDNYYCFGWGWYLSNDIQMFLVSLLPLFVYVMSGKLYGKSMVIFLLVITQIIGIVVSYHFEFQIPGFSISDPDQNQWYYIKPYCRAPPYFLGLILGILYRESKQYSLKHDENEPIPILYQFQQWTSKTSLRKLIVSIVCYIIGFGIILLLWFGWRKPQSTNQDAWSSGFQSFYYSICRLLFTFGLSFITLPNLLGLKDIFNTTIMGCTGFRFLAKISFTAYLLHYIFIMITDLAFYQTASFTFQNSLNFFFANFALTACFATLMTLLIEMPFGKLEQRLLAYLAGGKKQIVNAPDLSAQMLRK